MTTGGEDDPDVGAPDAKDPDAPKRGRRRGAPRANAARRKDTGIAAAAIGGTVVALPAIISVLKQIQQIQGLVQQAVWPFFVIAAVAAVLFLRQLRQRRTVAIVRKQSESGALLKSLVLQLARDDKQWTANDKKEVYFARGQIIDELRRRRGWNRPLRGMVDSRLKRLIWWPAALVTLGWRLLIGALDGPTLEDLADEILAKAVAKKWITPYREGDEFDDYYATTRGKERRPSTWPKELHESVDWPAFVIANPYSPRSQRYLQIDARRKSMSR